jgi:anti-sigma factor RsiW
MEDRTGTVTCERSDDLVSFLYQELDEREGRDFEHHLEGCSSCARELALFSEVRNGVVAWREQSLGMVSSNQPASVAFNHSSKPSALAAMRQFFALSPVWLKGAVAFASVLLFAVVAFLLLSLNAKPAAPVAAIDKVYTEAELRAKVEAEIQARLKELNQQQNVVKEDLVRTPVLVQSKPKPKSSVYTAKIRRAPLTKSEREQLAADLRLISPTEDDLNLLGEQINR